MLGKRGELVLAGDSAPGTEIAIEVGHADERPDAQTVIEDTAAGEVNKPVMVYR